MPFDFDAAVLSPFRMQPGLRRLDEGMPQLTPLAAGGRHQREKLAVLSAFWPQALCAAPGFDALPALRALCAQASAEHPQAFAFDGRTAQALGVAVRIDDGALTLTAAGIFGLGDEVGRCLAGLPAEWRLAGLLSLAFAEDLAIVDAAQGTLPWLCVCLPSQWAPEEKLGRHFTDVHTPVADNTLLLKAAVSLLRLICGAQRWERFVWTITDHPRLHAHPLRTPAADGRRWLDTPVALAWFRTEHQTFIPLPALQQAVFTIHVEVEPLQRVTASPARAAALHAAVASMSPQVLDYRGLVSVREPLLDWLAARADGAAGAAGTVGAAGAA